MTRVLIFDLGGVLINNVTFAELRKLAIKPIGEQDLKDRWLHSATVREFELGNCTAEHFANLIIDELGISTTAREFVEAFTGWPKGFYDGAEHLLQQLRKQYPTVCLSNSNKLHWSDQVTCHFDYSYSSHIMRRIKPDPEVFEFVTADIGCKPSDILFFDDSQPNIYAAQNFGWQAYQTEGFSELNHALRTANIIK